MSWRWISLLTLALVAYAATGVYVVRGNEQAVVRWFGRAQPRLAVGGLHWGLPWPMGRVDRVNLNESRTVSVGLGLADEVDDSDFLKPLSSSRQSEYLTGDKNILHFQVVIQYRIESPQQYLLQQEAADDHLRFLAQSLAADLVSRSGVDYVLPLGLNQLRQQLTLDVRKRVAAHGMGIIVEDVTLADVRPPISVKQAFLDVANARAERERLISEAQTNLERQIAQAEARASQLQEIAEAERADELAAANGDANRFNALVDQFALDQEAGTVTNPQASSPQPSSPDGGGARGLAMQRLYWSVLEELLPRLSRQILVDGEQPIDVTIQRRQPVQPPARRVSP